MATATIISNTSGIAWSGVGDTNITETEDTTVTNSSGADVWYGVGNDTNTRLKNNDNHTFNTLTETVVYGFAQSKNTAAQITLTMTGNGGGTLKKGESSALRSRRTTSTTEEVSSGGVIDEVEVEVKIKVKLKDGKVVSVDS